MILISSAGGKTGKAMISAFSQAGKSVRAMVRRTDNDGELRALGAAEIFHGNLNDPAAVSAAAEGCSNIYYICPNMTEHELEMGKNIISAAQSVGVQRLGFHSVLHTQVQTLQHHWNRLFVEEAIVESGLPFSILQVGSYYQNMLPGWQKMLETGVHAMAYETGVPMSLVDLDEVAEAAVKVFADPGCEGGIFEICGPVITLTEKAEILTEILGRPIEAKKLPARDAIAHAAGLGVGEYGQNCMQRMFAHYDVHGLVGSPRVLEWILGRSPTDFRGFATRVSNRR